MPAQREIRPIDRQCLAGRDPQLPFDEVEPGHHLGDRMLDLQPGVHLDEIKALAVGDELNRAGPDIANGARRRYGGLAHRSPPLGIEIWRRRFLDYLLIAPLDRAVALEEVDRVAVA